MSSASPPPSGSPAPPAKTCRCGYGRGHVFVSAEPQYSGFHFWMGVLMGVSMGEPKSVRFRCRRCGDVIEETRDPEVLRAHR